MLTAGAPNANNNHGWEQDTDCVSRRRLEEERLLQEEHTNRSSLDNGYWDGLGQHIRFNAKEEETGGSWWTNKTITDLHIFYEEPDILIRRTGKTTTV